MTETLLPPGAAAGRTKAAKARAKRTSVLVKIAHSAVCSPTTLRRKLPWLRQKFQEADAVSSLLNVLIAAHRTFDGLDLIAETLLVAQLAGRQEEAEALLLADRAFCESLPWPNDFFLARYRLLDRRAIARLLRCKYALRGPVTERSLVPLARKESARIQFPPGLLDNLYAHSLEQGDRTIWERKVRIAFLMDHIVSELAGLSPGKVPVERMLTSKGLRAFEQLSDRATLLLTFHGGYLTLTKHAVLLALPDAMRLQAASPRDESEISISVDPAAALFSALRSLQDGGQLLMAADPSIGKLRGSIEVLGKTVPIADGAAFLAYESGCRTIWVTMRRSKDGFAPAMVDAPAVEPGESFRSFKARLHAFYGAQIENLLRGDPRDIVFRTLWAKIVASADTGGRRSSQA